MVVILLIALFSNPIIQTDVIKLVKGRAGGVGSSAIDYNSTLSVQVIHYEPRINWYDFQENTSSGWVSRLNRRIDVDNQTEYRFIINISSDQGWDDIEHINISAWYDNGSETTLFNETSGGNLNLNILHQNTTGAGSTQLIWPRNNSEITYVGYTERVVTDVNGLENYTETRNMTFSFKPNCQFRYAPGENETWVTTYERRGNSSFFGLFNNYSWNFNITITDAGHNLTGLPDPGISPSTTWVANEFGVNAYTEIVSAESPTITGFPGNTFESSPVEIITKTNANYNLSVNISDLKHEYNNSIKIENEDIFVKGGNRSTYGNLSTKIYLYGGDTPNYQPADASGIQKTTNDIQYQVYIEIGKLAGFYSNHIYYHLKIEE